MPNINKSEEDFTLFFDQLIEQQKNKVLKMARVYYPGITAEDARNPQDFPKLMKDPNFNFEDGILCGYVAAKMAAFNFLKS